MEEHKRRYLRDILSRKPKGWLEDFLVTVKGLEERARNYYSEVVTLDNDSFVEMMILHFFGFGHLLMIKEKRNQ